MTIFLIILPIVTFFFGAFLGWRDCDAYWLNRAERRPESIHLGPYPKVPGEFGDLSKVPEYDE